MPEAARPAEAAADASPFRSFWMGGFEAADHVNGEGRAVDMALECGHVDRVEEDHRLAAERGLLTVRESVGWRLAEPAPGRYDFARAVRIARSAEAHGLQVVWSLMHYGTPADVDLFDDRLVERFRRFAAAAADRLGPHAVGPAVWNPINEISFVSWVVAETNLFHPYRGDAAHGGQADPAQGYGVKKRLIRATLEAIDAIRQVDPRARFLHVDPMVHVAPPLGQPEFAALATTVTNHQWQTWDMLAGRTEPQLGGHPAALDLIGVNHYHSSQWEMPGGARLEWHGRDPRRRPLAALLADGWARYGRPMIVAETSHFGDGRAAWFDQVAAEVRDARRAGVPVEGLCLYPLVDRPDWTNRDFWHHSGLWDVAGAAQEAPAPGAADAPAAAPTLRRVLAPDYAAALARWQAELPVTADPADRRPAIVVFSPLRWDGLWHRPQQLMTRLAARWRIVFVEEPVTLDPSLPPCLDRIRHRPGLEVLVPRLHGPMRGFDPAAREAIAPLLARYLVDESIARPIAWCATPLGWPLAETLDARARVVDCSDELAAFEGAPAEIAALEPRALRGADLVICAGPALAVAKARCRPDLHLVPNGVDTAIFRSAHDPDSHDARATRLLLRGIGRPRLGYAGAIDERLDLALLATLADARPDRQLVMVGPVCKIDPATLPRRPNLHWLPFQPHGRLPHLFGAWDAALLPFVDSPATRAANPTKLLEYRAAGLPVVATALPDVVALHAGGVALARSRSAFIAACDDALAGRGPDPTLDPAAPSWDACADALDRLLRALA